MIVNKKILLMGVATLLITGLVYLVDRPTEQTLVLKILGINSPYNGYRIFGVMGPFIPSLGHAMSFSLISASCFNYNTAQNVLICFSWFLINAIFEIAQMHHFDNLINIPLLHNYIEGGTFDPMDLVSAGFGSLFAFSLLQYCKCMKHRSDLV